MIRMLKKKGKNTFRFAWNKAQSLHCDTQWCRNRKIFQAYILHFSYKITFGWIVNEPNFFEYRFEIVWVKCIQIKAWPTKECHTIYPFEKHFAMNHSPNAMIKPMKISSHFKFGLDYWFGLNTNMYQFNWCSYFIHSCFSLFEIIK